MVDKVDRSLAGHLVEGSFLGAVVDQVAAFQQVGDSAEESRVRHLRDLAEIRLAGASVDKVVDKGGQKSVCALWFVHPSVHP